jgi:hypothetical protein
VGGTETIVAGLTIMSIKTLCDETKVKFVGENRAPIIDCFACDNKAIIEFRTTFWTTNFATPQASGEMN